MESQHLIPTKVQVFLSCFQTPSRNMFFNFSTECSIEVYQFSALPSKKNNFSVLILREGGGLSSQLPLPSLSGAYGFNESKLCDLSKFYWDSHLYSDITLCVFGSKAKWLEH